MDKKTLYIVVPCYNEEIIIDKSSAALLDCLNGLIGKGKVSPKSQLLFIDDGSKDKTWEKIYALSLENKNISAVRFYQNRGHQYAVYGGLDSVQDYADITISIDADLQDDITVIETMIDKYYQGYDLVCGVRSSRATDSFFKRFTAESYYKVLKLFGVDSIYNHADFRLMSKRAVKALMQFKDSSLFLRGYTSKIGLPTTTVEYSRLERCGGESKYTLIKMLRLASKGIISFSKKPLKLPYAFSFLSLLSALVMLVLAISFRLHLAPYIFGTALFAILMFCMGIFGTYIAELIDDNKAHPRYLIYEANIHHE